MEGELGEALGGKETVGTAQPRRTVGGRTLPAAAPGRAAHSRAHTGSSFPALHSQGPTLFLRTPESHSVLANPSVRNSRGGSSAPTLSIRPNQGLEKGTTVRVWMRTSSSRRRAARRRRREASPGIAEPGRGREGRGEAEPREGKSRRRGRLERPRAKGRGEPGRAIAGLTRAALGIIIKIRHSRDACA